MRQKRGPLWLQDHTNPVRYRKRPRLQPWEVLAEKSPAVRRVRLPSRPGVRRRRRNRLARGSDFVHAVSATHSLSAVPAAKEWSADALEHGGHGAGCAQGQLEMLRLQWRPAGGFEGTKETALAQF